MSPITQNPILEIQNLSCQYDKIIALSDVSLSIYPGEIVSLIGANGAGKTTLLRTISGLNRASKGSIAFEGKEITRQSPDRRVRAGIAQVPDCLLYTSPSPRD